MDSLLEIFFFQTFIHNVTTNVYEVLAFKQKWILVELLILLYFEEANLCWIFHFYIFFLCRPLF